MIHKLHPFGNGVIGHLLRRRDAADAARVNLHEAQPGVINHCAGLVKIMAALAAREFHRLAALGQFVIGGQRAIDERLFQPNRAANLQRGQPFFRSGSVVTPNRAGIHQQRDVLAQAFARGVNVRGVGFRRAASIRTPAKFCRAIPGARRRLRPTQRRLRIVAEQLRGVGCFRERALVTQQPPDGFAQFFAEQIPERDVNS